MTILVPEILFSLGRFKQLREPPKMHPICFKVDKQLPMPEARLLHLQAIPQSPGNLLQHPQIGEGTSFNKILLLLLNARTRLVGQSLRGNELCSIINLSPLMVQRKELDLAHDWTKSSQSFQLSRTNISYMPFQVIYHDGNFDLGLRLSPMQPCRLNPKAVPPQEFKSQILPLIGHKLQKMFCLKDLQSCKSGHQLLMLDHPGILAHQIQASSLQLLLWSVLLFLQSLEAPFAQEICHLACSRHV